MDNIWIYVLIQFGLIILGLNIWLIRSLYLKNKKLEEIVLKQNSYLEQMYEVIKYTESRIKQIDANGTFQGDDEVGFFFKAIKDVQENLSEYIKFIK